MAAVTQPDQAPDPFAGAAAFVDGEFVPVAEARIPLTDLGFIRSDTTYDVVHVWKGRFFRLDDHIDRFLGNCAALRLDIGRGRDELATILHRLVALSGLDDAYVSFTASRGPLPPGTRDPLACTNRLYGFCIPFMWIARLEEQEAGIDMIVASAMRTPKATFDQKVKNYQWGDLTSSMIEAGERGAKVAVLLDGEGNVTEGAGFNVFALEGGRLHTPDDGIFFGMTRRTVIELSRTLNIETRVEKVPVERLRDADEVFITTTAGGVIPVRSLDGVNVGDGAPGPVAMRLRALYWQAHEDPAYATAVVHDA
jgi:branched-chain amino acid aminotransferase